MRLDHFFVILCCFLLLFAFSLPNSPPQALADETEEWKELEVINGDFEKPYNNGQVPEWSFWSGGMQEGMSISETTVFEGSQSLEVINSGVTGLTSRSIGVKEGVRYRVNARLYPEELEGNPGIWLRWLNENNEIIGNSPKYFENLTLNKWNHVTVEDNAPVGATSVTIFIYQSSTAQMKGFYDDIKIFKKLDSDSIQIENSSFEKPLQAGEIPDWDTYPTTLRPDTSIEIVDTESADGEKSVRIVDETNKSSVGLYSSSFQVDSKKVYEVSGKAKITAGNASLYIKFYDDGGNEIDSFRSGYEALQDQWIDILVEGKAPKNAKSAKIFLYSGVTGKSNVSYDAFTAEIKQQLDLPFEFGDPINLGPAALASKAQGVAIGNGEIYFATNGSPSTFYAVDAFTGEVKFSQSIPGNDVVWAVAVAADGNIYFSGTYNGILYRYSPEQKVIESMGTNPSDNWVWELESSSDGKIYGATYPNSKVFEYDTESGQFRDIGQIKEGEKYARGLGVTDDAVYVGIGTTAYLYRIDRETGEKTEIDLPITGEQTTISNIWEFNGQLFVVYGTSMIIMDLETSEILKQIDWQDEHTFDGMISPPSPYDENIVYYRDKRTSELWTYNMETFETNPVEPRVKLPGSSAKGYEWITNEDGTQVLAILHNQIEYTRYNPTTNELEVLYPEVDLQGLAIQSLEIGEDQNIYMGGYQGSFGIYDTSEEKYTLHERDPHQIEGIGFLNDDVFLGTYGGARIYKYDPEQPYQFNEGSDDNPKMVYDIPDAQSRPFTFTSGDDKLFTGTISDYGTLGGALSIYDKATDEWGTIRNIVENQSIIGLAFKNGKVFGGSTIAGGLGIDPVANEAKMFEYDVVTKQSETFDLNVEGLETPEMIGELSFGPDGNLWGTAYGYKSDGIGTYAIFAMDPTNREIAKSMLLYEGVSRGSQWRPFFMRWDNNGYLYTTAARKLTVIDPETMQWKQLLGDTINLMDIDQEGNIYFAEGEDLIKLPLTIESVNLTTAQLTVLQGEEVPLELRILLSNGNEADLHGAEIEWSVSDTHIAEVADGKLQAKNGGSVNISATVAYNGETVTTNQLTLTVQVTPGSLEVQIEGFESESKFSHATAMKLKNHLRQAQHHYDKGNIKEAQKHIEKFKWNLERSHASEEVKVTLKSNVERLFQ
ncbi:FIMAH domain-containing protein [Pseudalkalibacillus sp. A8]|uniref:FIMAH domain-containing protein n=1 Tax=Pseudalkalibacillus sp. A8 TaxID=3382641 RepID=UPI0038B679CF